MGNSYKECGGESCTKKVVQRTERKGGVRIFDTSCQGGTKKFLEREWPPPGELQPISKKSGSRSNQHLVRLNGKRDGDRTGVLSKPIKKILRS